MIIIVYVIVSFLNQQHFKTFNFNDILVLVCELPSTFYCSCRGWRNRNNSINGDWNHVSLNIVFLCGIVTFINIKIKEKWLFVNLVGQCFVYLIT